MASGKIQPQNSTNFIGQNYGITLTQSLEALLSSPQTGNPPNNPNFTSVFHQLLQSKLDPPLETIWVYSALTHLETNSTKIEPLDQLSAVKDLFQLIISCSASCNPLKSIALVAPVVYNLHKFIVNLKGFELSSKKEKKVKREIRSLIGSVLGYVNVCFEGLCVNNNSDEFEQNLVRPLGDLVSIWIGDRMVENGKNQEGLREFFPLLSASIVEGVVDAGCELSELAGLVVAEAFLMKLCMELQEGNLRKEVENELRIWIIGSVTGLQNTYFFGTLLMMLLEPSLPVTSLLDPEAELFLRKILYDAVILVEYSFLTPDRLANLPAKHVKRIAMSRLIVMHEAIESLRKQGEEQKKTIAYINAFGSSSLPSQLIKFVRNEIEIDVKANGPTGTSPRAYLRWILNLENRGLKIFDDGLSKSRAKLIVDNLVEYPEQPDYKEGRKNSDADLLFYVDKKGEEEEGNEENGVIAKSMNAVFMTAAQSMQATENGRPKRKAKDAEKEEGVKFLKYDRYENSDLLGERSTSLSKDDLSSDSDVDNPSSDEDM